MKLTVGVIAALSLLPSALAQTTIKKDVESAIVWSGPQCQKSDTLLGVHEPLCDGVPSAHPEASSIVQDPLTGNSLRKISYEGVERHVWLEVICPWLRLERLPHGVRCDIHDCEQYGIPAEARREDLHIHFAAADRKGDSEMVG